MGLPLPSQALFKQWGSTEDASPTDVLTYTELVLDAQGKMVQLNRLPGGNEVSAEASQSLREKWGSPGRPETAGCPCRPRDGLPLFSSLSWLAAALC